ncbi:unnamed protein product [Rhizoctonia solani]|uniref:Uncharacterized protein n=1 Tax=Rhizoctonia solani TaxID=456999 RepID=A0A8H2Y0A5_9AGAM|nr:unnamed protein product [Rhizoctonia solani]
MQLSQHLFSAQTAVFQADYSTSLITGERSVFAPPVLPPHIPGTLNRVVGIPSDDDIKAVQNAVQSVENLVNSPQLFDADLSMKLSQHMFNLQIARYVHDSSQAPQPTQEAEKAPCLSQEVSGLFDKTDSDVSSASPSLTGSIESEKIHEASSGLALLGEKIAKAIKDSTNETKIVLEKMHRMLTLIKQDQAVVASLSQEYHVYKNPLNQQGIAASECGLPLLRYGYNCYSDYVVSEKASQEIVGYLKFFGIGVDLIQEGEDPKLIAGKESEAQNLLLKHIHPSYA